LISDHIAHNLFIFNERTTILFNTKKMKIPNIGKQKP
jgi:hypothetical protein